MRNNGRLPCRDCKRPRLPSSPDGRCGGCRSALSLITPFRGRRNAEALASDERIEELAARAAAGEPLFPQRRED